MTSWDPTTRSPRTDPLARWASLVLYAALVTIGLMAGLFYAWDVSVMPGFADLDDRTFVSAMQILVVAIENLAFLLVFVGAFGFTAAAALLQRRRGQRLTARWIAAALVLYCVALVVTVAVHLPLNHALVDAGDPGQTADLVAVRDDFEVPWRVANVVRTVTCGLALVCLGRALSLEGREQGEPRSA
jgi:uncharacterized membrane protein